MHYIAQVSFITTPTELITHPILKRLNLSISVIVFFFSLKYKTAAMWLQTENRIGR